MKQVKNQKHETNASDRGRAFRVMVTETYRRIITVYESELKAPVAQEAVRQVEDWWNGSQIELTADDFQGVEFITVEEDNPSTDGKEDAKR